MLIWRSWQRCAKAAFSAANSGPSSSATRSAEGEGTAVRLPFSVGARPDRSKVRVKRTILLLRTFLSTGYRLHVTASNLTPGDLALRPGSGVRSPWLREALALEDDPAPLPGPRSD